MTGVIPIVRDSNHGPYREISIRVELRVKDKGFHTQLNQKAMNS